MGVVIIQVKLPKLHHLGEEGGVLLRIQHGRRIVVKVVIVA